MTDLTQREHLVGLIDEASEKEPACQCLPGHWPIAQHRTSLVQPKAGAQSRWQAARPEPANKYTKEEFDRMLAVCNSAEFASLPPSQIVPTLADRGEYIGSESTFYRALRAASVLSHRGRSQARQRSSAPTTHTATAPIQVWMMDVT